MRLYYLEYESAKQFILLKIVLLQFPTLKDIIKRKLIDLFFHRLLTKFLKNKTFNCIIDLSFEMFLLCYKVILHIIKTRCMILLNHSKVLYIFCSILLIFYFEQHLNAKKKTVKMFSAMNIVLQF